MLAVFVYLWFIQNSTLMILFVIVVVVVYSAQ